LKGDGKRTALVHYAIEHCSIEIPSRSGLPDGTFSDQKLQFGNILEGIEI
jgi:hypothetical protein